MKSRRSTTTNSSGTITVERTNNLISQYIRRVLSGQVIIPDGTPENRVVAVIEKLSDLPMGFIVRR